MLKFHIIIIKFSIFSKKNSQSDTFFPKLKKTIVKIDIKSFSVCTWNWIKFLTWHILTFFQKLTFRYEKESAFFLWGHLLCVIFNLMNLNSTNVWYPQNDMLDRRGLGYTYIAKEKKRIRLVNWPRYCRIKMSVFYSIVSFGRIGKKLLTPMVWYQIWKVQKFFIFPID